MAVYEDGHYNMNYGYSSSERNSMPNVGCDVARKQASKERQEYWKRKKDEAEARNNLKPATVNNEEWAF